jgi:hypothetical protein
MIIQLQNEINTLKIDKQIINQEFYNVRNDRLDILNELYSLKQENLFLQK